MATKLYNFNNRKYQHTLDSARTRLRNMIWDAEHSGHDDIAKRFRASYERLDDVCDRNGVYCAPYMIKVTYEDWKVLDAARRWYEGIRLSACSR